MGNNSYQLEKLTVLCLIFEGARASASFYSLIETKKANGLEPYGYLKYMFEKFPYAETSEDIFNLLPMNVLKTDLNK